MRQADNPVVVLLERYITDTLREPVRELHGDGAGYTIIPRGDYTDVVYHLGEGSQINGYTIKTTEEKIGRLYVSLLRHGCASTVYGTVEDRLSPVKLRVKNVDLFAAAKGVRP